MDEYVCVQVTSGPGETSSDFNKRLINFWSHFLRTRPDEYEGVYAETSRFESVGDRVVRRYLISLAVVPTVESELKAGGIELEPIDPDDLFSKFEAAGPEWFQIPH